MSVLYRQYVGETDLPHIMSLCQSELSEPYVIYTFRYFLHSWAHLSFLAYPSDPNNSDPIGVVICKQEYDHHKCRNRGYIAMLVVKRDWRKQGIASALVKLSIQAMKDRNVDEIVLETEYDNHAALSLYESLDFIREKRLYRFYLNGKDAFRLIHTVKVPDEFLDPSNSYGSPMTSYFQQHSYRAIRISDDSDDDSDEPSSR